MNANGQPMANQPTTSQHGPLQCAALTIVSEAHNMIITTTTQTDDRNHSTTFN